ncbi:MAG: GNAT family N-acetyltransferase [Campylobacteraceae bacterium]|nr:GNAT family N-acetyltransferase [Campylobacteraceae bacterium]
MAYGIKIVGFAKIVTNNSAVYCLCDAIIDEEYRSNRLGKKLIEFKKLKGMSEILTTKDTHKLYENHRFECAPQNRLYEKIKRAIKENYQ